MTTGSCKEKYPELYSLLSRKEEKPLEDLIEDGNAQIPDHLYKIYKEKTAQVIERIKQIGLPHKNEQLRLITMQSFNSIAFIELVAKTEIITEGILVIFAINMKAAKSLIDLFESGKIQKLNLVISSVRNAGYSIKSKAVEMLSEVKEISMCFVNSHAKISALKTGENNYYVIEGSGNFSYNGRIEQYIIDNDQYMFEFTQQWVTKMKESMMSKADFKVVNE